MARITVEDCLEKIDNQYDLVLLAKERTVQLNAGAPMLVEEDNDKRTIISLREIGDWKISVKELEDSAIKRLRKDPDESEQQEEMEEETNDDFENLYKGQISKSGVAILPSKRTRRIPEVKKSTGSNLAKEALSGSGIPNSSNLFWAITLKAPIPTNPINTAIIINQIIG